MADENQTPLMHRKATPSGIKMLDLADGGKEFISPAMRNFREKMSFSILLLVFAAAFVGFTFFIENFISGLPFAWARFLAANVLFYHLAILGLVVLLLGYLCLDLWLRSSRVVAVAGELRIVTHWLFLKRTDLIPASKIIETKAANNTTVDDTCYYDIMVLTVGEGQGWLAALYLAANKPDRSDSSFTENDRKVLNTGGKKIRAMTNIIGETEAQWILGQLRAALGINI